MRRTPTLFFARSKTNWKNLTNPHHPPIIKITNGTFYTHHPSTKPPPTLPPSTFNPPLFPNLTLSLPSTSSPPQAWAILSPSSNIRTQFLQILRGALLCDPPTARSYPYLLSPETQSKPRSPDRAISYIGFDVERRAFGGAYLSARYESRVEVTDFTLAQYLSGITGLNVDEAYIRENEPEKAFMLQVVRDLELENLIDMPVSMLSNGQSRRARIGKALLKRPEMVCLDAPFIGLDPIVTRHISLVLRRLALSNSPRIVLSLRPQDSIPDWITHLVYASEDGNVATLGPKDEVFNYLKQAYESAESAYKEPHNIDPKLVEMREVGRHLSSTGNFNISTPKTKISRDGFTHTDTTPPPTNLPPPVVEMSGVQISYGPSSVLGNWHQPSSPTRGLYLTIHPSQRWAILGPNGSGKTTLLSLITSDHPQTYSAPVKILGRSRLPEPGKRGITIFDIQRQIGHAGPEVHALFPKHLTIRRVVESAWADTPVSKPQIGDMERNRVERALKWFEPELNPLYNSSDTATKKETEHKRDLSWADTYLFGELSFSPQRILLFLRATIHSPAILILDEAFSGIDDISRDKCKLFLSHGEAKELHYSSTADARVVESDIAKRGEVVLKGLSDDQALLVVSHSRQDVPGCVREWVCLPEVGSGEAPRFGRWDGPVELEGGRWEEVWGCEG